MIKKLLTYSLLSLFFVVSCNSDDDSNNQTVTSQILFKPKVGTEDYSLSDTVTYANGHTLRYDDFKFFISNIRMVATNGEEHYVDSVKLIDFKSAGTELFDIQLESGPYEKIKFGIGLSPDLNGTDPTLRPIEHPLSVLNNMYWSWATMFKFIHLAGFYAENPTDDLTETFAWHPGRDQLYREVEFNLNQKHFYDDTVLEINLDVSTLMNKTEVVNVPNESSWHGSLTNISVAEKIVDNFAASLSIKN